MKLSIICHSSIICLFLISGCASSPEVSQKSTAQLIEESSAALSSGKRETAIAPLDNASKINPASAPPWLKQAQLHFEADNYPAAIQAADEAMKRDPANKEAKAIAVVASLRVAIRALSDMSQDSVLRGTNRSEAERLARALRETLDQDVLLPIDPPKAGAERNQNKTGRNVTTRQPVRVPPSPQVSSPGTTPAPVSAKPQAATTGSPFGALK
jgi:hypothetical protein